jgi:hypothetical protein
MSKKEIRNLPQAPRKIPMPQVKPAGNPPKPNK